MENARCFVLALFLFLIKASDLLPETADRLVVAGFDFLLAIAD
jgi:hypothetical protein